MEAIDERFRERRDTTHHRLCDFSRQGYSVAKVEEAKAVEESINLQQRQRS